MARHVFFWTQEVFPMIAAIDIEVSDGPKEIFEGSFSVSVCKLCRDTKFTVDIGFLLGVFVSSALLA